MRDSQLELTLTVPDKSSVNSDRKLGVTLKFESSRDFRPDAIARQVPELRALVEIREALRFLRGPLANRREFRRRIEALVKDESQRQRLMEELGIDREL
jgi:type VI secretion system protein ImpB